MIVCREKNVAIVNKLCIISKHYFQENHVHTGRVRPSVPVAAPIDSIFTTPTRAAPLKSIVDSFAASAVSNTNPSNSRSRHFSETPVQRVIDSGLSNSGHTHVHDHGVSAAAQTALKAGDTTVHKTEVIYLKYSSRNCGYIHVNIFQSILKNTCYAFQISILKTYNLKCVHKYLIVNIVRLYISEIENKSEEIYFTLTTEKHKS